MSSIVCLIATWHDEQLLAEAVASAAPYVDRVVVLDGAYAGLGESPSSTDAELGAAAVYARVDVFRVFGVTFWPDEIAKRNVLLELGRAFVSGLDRWALVLDADEVLVNGERLRERLEVLDHRVFAPGLPRVEPNGQVWQAPSRLFRLTDFVRYFELSYQLLDTSGQGWRLYSLEHSPAMPVDPLAPWVDHRWDLRSPARLAVQREWGRRLAELDHGR